MAKIRHIFHIDASFEKVFDAMTSANGLRGWWTTDVQEKEKSLIFSFGGNALCEFEVIEMNPTKSFRWKCLEGHPDWVDTEILVELSANDDKVKVDFQHTGWKEENAFLAHCNFSWGRYLVSLRNLCESGKGDPFDQ